jgi:hypothetical protein
MINREPRSVSDEPMLAPLLARMGDRNAMMLSTDAGWDVIIAQTDARLAELDPDYVVEQVKEKFGGLRFYYRPSSPDPAIQATMQSVVAEAEAKAARTCEISGRDDGVLGRWRGHNWLRTLSLSVYGPQGFEPLPTKE